MTKNETLTNMGKLILQIGALAFAIVGLSSIYVVGYMTDIPREAFLVFGRQITLSVGLEASFQATFSFITAKVVLILVAVCISLIGGFFSSPKFEKISKKLDNLAVSTALAPLKTVLFLACIVYFIRFLHFSTDAIMLVGGFILFGSILFKSIDRILVRRLKRFFG